MSFSLPQQRSLSAKQVNFQGDNTNRSTGKRLAD